MKKKIKFAKHIDYVKLTSKALGIKISGYYETVEKICDKALDKNREASVKEHEMIVAQENLISAHLSLVDEAKSTFYFKYSNVERLEYELGFNDLFSVETFETALNNLIDHKEIYIHEEKNGIRRIYDWDFYILLMKASYFYGFLEFLWVEEPSPRLDRIWEEYCGIEKMGNLSKKMFFKLIRLLEKKLLVLRSKDEDGRIIVKRLLYSQKTKEDILK